MAIQTFVINGSFVIFLVPYVKIMTILLSPKNVIDVVRSKVLRRKMYNITMGMFGYELYITQHVLSYCVKPSGI